MDNPSGSKFIFLDLLMLLAYMVLIFVLSVRPAPESIPGIWQMDKLIHAVVYAIMGLLALRVTAGRRAGSAQSAAGRRSPAPALYAFFISFFFGALMEVAQTFTVARQGSFFDGIANGVGAYVGVYIAGGLIVRQVSTRN